MTTAAQKLAWRRRNPDKVRAYNAQQRANRRRTRWGVTQSPRPDVDERCQICGIREDVSSPLHLDHDHTTGQFRGWLCGPCNRGLGLFRDDPDRLGAAQAYAQASARARVAVGVPRVPVPGETQPA